MVSEVMLTICLLRRPTCLIAFSIQLTGRSGFRLACCLSKTVLYADDSVLLCSDVNTEKLKVNVKIRFFYLKTGLIRADFAKSFKNKLCVVLQCEKYI